MTAVRVTGLTKRFGSTPVLRGVGIEVPDGAFAVLVGPSGCGKSTLLRLLAGLEEADEGTIRFGDDDVTHAAPRDRDVAMVFQSYALYPHLTVRENLAFGLRLRKTPEPEIAARVAEVSEMLGLGALLDRLPKALSGGQRQRVAMGRAIVRRPRLFLFDEPLSNLDAALRAQVRVEIKNLHERLKATSVYVTHDQVEAMTLADVMFVLNKGVVEQAGAPLEVYDRPATRFVAGFLGSPAINVLEAVVEAPSGGEARITAPGVAVSVALAEYADLTAGRPVFLGVRPHDLELAAAAPNAELSVTLVEALGGETYAHGRIAGAAFVARLPADMRVSKGDSLPLAFKRVHLFDPSTGKSLRR